MFYTSFTNENGNKYYRITCNLLDDVITVTRRKSQQFNFSLHVKINHIKFKDNFW